ncbi:MAG: hypothetical protein EBU66_13565 [Bacteroidetes bacterium]|nr:hypothetical protein [bacterium]NBP65674.1 hypothetical protein [Bacteroidota bacterium]
MQIKDLPIELQYKIIRFLDIDTRRILGIYTHLKVPNVLKEKIENIPKVQSYNSYDGYVNLGIPKQVRYRELTVQKHKYKLYAFTWLDATTQIKLVVERNDDLNALVFYDSTFAYDNTFNTYFNVAT